MITLDRRTRTNADIRNIDPANFFNVELPALIRDRSNRAVPGAREFAVSSITFVLPAGNWTLALTEAGLDLQSGDMGRVAIEMADGIFADIVNDLATPEMLVSLGKVKVIRGERNEMNCWWGILRALLDDRDLFTAGSIHLKDRDGCDLDITRSFTPDDDDAEIAHFLAEAGFLHLSGWLDESVMNDIAEDIDRTLPTCTSEDGSWWATLADGTRCPVRIADFAEHSVAVRELLTSQALQRIGRLTDDGYILPTYIEALHKPIGVVAGISDIDWHNDCAQGLHSYRCCSLVVGISVTGAGPGSAQLGVIPGSHRALLPSDRPYPHTGLEPFFIETRTGDITVHCSCTMHKSKRPTEYERKALYASLGLPERDKRTIGRERVVFETRQEVQKIASRN